jgi:hypothetical protein
VGEECAATEGSPAGCQLPGRIHRICIRRHSRLPACATSRAGCVRPGQTKCDQKSEVKPGHTSCDQVTGANTKRINAERKIDIDNWFCILGTHEVRYPGKGERGERKGPLVFCFNFNFFISLKKIIGIAILAAVCMTSGFVSAAPHKLRVEDPALARTLAAQGGKVIGEYGAFTVLDADDALLSGANSNRVEMADDWNLVRLNAREMDTTTMEVKALRKSRGAFAGRQLHLVQFAGPVKAEWLEELKRSGARVVSYIPENTYLIYGDAPSLMRMQSWAGKAAFVQWEGEYSHDLKVHPNARLTSNPGKAEVRAFVIQLVADTNANPATLALIDQLKGQGVRKEISSIAPYRNMMVSLRTDQLDTVASQPDVVSIHPFAAPKRRDERQDQILAGNLTGNSPTGPGYLAWLASKGFTQAQFDASGFVVDVADAGIDNGTQTPGHFGLYPLGDTGQSSRVAYSRFEGTPNPGGTLAGCDGHGTLNSHIIANYDGITSGLHVDAEGFSYGVGVCPFARVGASVIFDNSDPNNDYTFPDFNTLVSDAYKSHARVVNNSWGNDAGGAYDSSSQNYDQLVRDADASAGGNQEMVIVFAAGNAGPCTTGTTIGIDSPGSAKNVITVGASENVRSLSTANGGNDSQGRDACDESDAGASSANNMACHSSRGPCQDKRMKPDLVAPGVHVTGGTPQNTPPPDPNGPGSALDCFNALGVCALIDSGTNNDPNNFFPLGQQFYTESSGTSHSTPAVTGGCALLRQYFINNGLNPPSPAMTKAFLMNSARYMTGVGANDNLWSVGQGMGEMNLGMALDGEARYLRDQMPADMFTGTGQIRAYAGHVVDTSKPFRVTLAWTDAPGSTAGAAYNNNLDLTVTIGGNTYKGNVFKGQFSTTGGSADTRNNVESVFLPAGVGGDFVVAVTAANINSSGVPGSGSAVSQDFALVIYNSTASNAPAYTPVAASYSGLFFEPGGAQVGKSGAVTLKTTASRTYSGKLQMGTANLPFSGTFTIVGTATNVISRKGAPSLGLMLTMNTNSDFVTGSVSDGGTFTANLLANRAVSAASGAAPFAGSYTLIFPGTNNNSQLPAGNGYGTVSVSSMGKIKLAGALGDGTKLSQSTVASTDGQWPLYASLYSGQGQILGWMTFTNPPQGGVGGQVDWFKPPNGNLYPVGFNFETLATGSIYSSAASPLIGFNNGMLVLSGGNLANAFTNGVSVSGSTVTGTNNLKMKFNASKGTFTGSVVNPFSGISMPFNGVYLQNEGFGAGDSLGTNQSSSVFFGP